MTLELDIRKAGKALQRLAKEAEDNNGMNFSVLFSEKNPYVCQGHGCYGDMSRTYFNPGSKDGIVGVVDYPWRGATLQTRKDEEANTRFLTWLANESMWADYFVSKDPEDIFKNGVIYSTYKKDGRGLFQAMASVRMIKFFPTHILTWDKLVQKGMDKMAAYLACHFFEYDTVSWQINTGGLSSGHNSMDFHIMGEIPVNNFLKTITFPETRYCIDTKINWHPSMSLFYSPNSKAGLNTKINIPTSSTRNKFGSIIHTVKDDDVMDTVKEFFMMNWNVAL